MSGARGSKALGRAPIRYVGFGFLVLTPVPADASGYSGTGRRFDESRVALAQGREFLTTAILLESAFRVFQAFLEID